MTTQKSKDFFFQLFLLEMMAQMTYLGKKSCLKSLLWQPLTIGDCSGENIGLYRGSDGLKLFTDYSFVNFVTQHNSFVIVLVGKKWWRRRHQQLQFANFSSGKSGVFISISNTINTNQVSLSQLNSPWKKKTFEVCLVT